MRNLWLRIAALALAIAAPVTMSRAYFAGNVNSAPDPFVFVENAASPGNNNTVGKTLYTGSLSSMTTIIIAGQSNTANSFPTPYTPSHSTVYNLNIYDGAIYKAADPLLGTSTSIIAGNVAGRIADNLINAGPSTSVLLVPVSIDGTAISSWTSSGNLGSRINAAIARVAARGLTVNAIIWGQGESDAGTPQAVYAAAFSTIVANSRAAGYIGPWFIAKQTMLSGVVNPTVQAAQLGAVNHSLGIWAGPDADSIGTSQRQDGTHFNDTGAVTYAGLWQGSLHAFGAPF